MILVFQVQLKPAEFHCRVLHWTWRFWSSTLLIGFFFGFYFQVSAWFFTTFTVSGLKDKLHYVESLQQLFTAIPPEQIDLPPFVLEYDARVSGCLWPPWNSALRAALCSHSALQVFKGTDFHTLRMGRRKREGFWRVCVVLWVMIPWIFCLDQPKQRPWLRRRAAFPLEQ